MGRMPCTTTIPLHLCCFKHERWPHDAIVLLVLRRWPCNRPWSHDHDLLKTKANFPLKALLDCDNVIGSCNESLQGAQSGQSCPHSCFMQESGLSGLSGLFCPKADFFRTIKNAFVGGHHKNALQHPNIVVFLCTCRGRRTSAVTGI